MKNSKALAVTALAGVFAVGVAGVSDAAKAEGEKEKCYGVAKAGKNDCATAKASCAGHSTEDGQADAWIFVPKGTCEKIAGGSTTPAGE